MNCKYLIGADTCTVGMSQHPMVVGLVAALAQTGGDPERMKQPLACCKLQHRQYFQISMCRWSSNIGCSLSWDGASPFTARGVPLAAASQNLFSQPASHTPSCANYSFHAESREVPDRQHLRTGAQTKCGLATLPASCIARVATPVHSLSRIHTRTSSRTRS